MTGLKVIDGTPTEISKMLRENKSIPNNKQNDDLLINDDEKISQSIPQLIEETEKEIEKRINELIGWEGEIIIKIKGKRFNVLVNRNKFVEIMKLDRLKAKLFAYKECLKIQEDLQEQLDKEIRWREFNIEHQKEFNENRDAFWKKKVEVLKIRLSRHWFGEDDFKTQGILREEIDKIFSEREE